MEPVKYRRPRVINPVSVTLVALLLAGGYAGYEFVRVYIQRQEAYRVLEETGSAFAGRQALYRRDTKEREALRRKMTQELVAIGLTDPDLETWIDVQPQRTSIGVVYTAWFHWPFDALAPIAHEYQVEHEVALPGG